MLKKILLSVCLLAVCIPGFVYAQAAAPSGFAADLQKQTNAAAGEQGAGFGKAQDPQAIVARIIQAFLGLLGILLVVYLIYGGALIFMSGGAEEKITEGKDTIRRAVMGLVVILGAYSLTIFVNSIIQNTDPCAPDENGDVFCITVQEDRRKYDQRNFDDTNPFTPYGGRVLPDGTRDLVN